MSRSDHVRRVEIGEPVGPSDATQRKLSLPALSAGPGGNLLEWYDFGIYGLLAPVLAGVFFPGEDRIASLIGA